MKKKFLSNLLLLLILNFLIKPFWFFGIEVAVQNRVGEEMYGFYFSLFNFAFILNILLDAGINNYNNRAVARDHSLITSNLSHIIPLKFFMSIVYAGVVFGGGLIIGYSPEQFKLLTILALNQFLASFILYFRSNISGIQLFRTDSLLSVLDRTLMIIFNGILLWTTISKEPYKIEWFVYSQTISYSITLITIFAIVRYHAGKIRFNLNMVNLKKILAQSYPFALLILLMAFFNRADSVMIERLLEDGKEQAGIYAQSFRVLDALSQFAVLFAGLLLPMFSKMIKTGESTEGLVKLSSSLLLAVSLAIAIIGIFYNEEIISLLYHESEGRSASIFRLLMIGFVFISISYIFGTLLTANGNLKHLNILAAITVTVNIVLNFILIPHYKAFGSAIASIISQGFYAISQVFLATRKISLSLSYRYFLQLALYIIIISLMGWLLHKYVNWLSGILLFLGGTAIFAILTGVIRPREIIRIFSED